MIFNDFGSSGVNVSKLGFGAGQIGSPDISDHEIEYLLNAVLDKGINLIDTARGYHLSEERIGRFISRRRHEFLLSTKVGYGIEGYADWTYECVIAGIDTALKILKTDQIDIAHLHSCPAEIIRNNGVADALLKTKEQGKIRFAAYSGENEDLKYALETNSFDSIQTSINIFDQAGISTHVEKANSLGLGIIGKRPLGNCPWLYNERPWGNYAETYWLRMKSMNLDFGSSWSEIALRFAAFHGGGHTIITGSRNFNHIKENISFLSKGPLPSDSTEEIFRAFRTYNENWTGQV